MTMLKRITSIFAIILLFMPTIAKAADFNPVYVISVEVSDGGTASASKHAASEGKKIYITAEAFEGYFVKEIVVKEDKTGVEIELDENKMFLMPSRAVTVYVEFEKIHICWNYTDIRGHWAEEEICSAIESGIMNGVSDTLFKPNADMTRAMLVTILYRMEGKPDTDGSNAFTDVKEDAWYFDAVRWAASADIVNGYSSDKFGPEDVITREQAASMLYRYAKWKGMDVSQSVQLDSFADSDKISDYAWEALSWAVGNEILIGAGGRHYPLDGIIRAESAAVIYRLTMLSK